MPTLAPGYQVESRLVEVIAKSCLFVKGCTRQRFRKCLVWKKHLSLLLEEVTVTSFCCGGADMYAVNQTLWRLREKDEEEEKEGKEGG